MAIRASSLAAAGLMLVGGPAGLPGQSTYAAWLALGNTGTLSDFMAAQKGADGYTQDISGKLDKTGDASGASATAAGAGQGQALGAWLANVGLGSPNLAGLRAIPTAVLLAGAVAVTTGYATAKDNGGGTWTWDATATATDTDDGCLVVKPTAVTGAGRWRRALGGRPLTPAMCGATGVGDESAIISLLLSRGVPVHIPAGTSYIVQGSVTVPAGAVIQLDGALLGLGTLTFAGSATITGVGSVGLGPSNPLSYLVLKFTAGAVHLRGFGVKPTGPSNPILISPSTAGIDDLEITGLVIDGAQFAILRDVAAPGSVSAARITQNLIRNGSGDGIEWNVGPNDRRLLIAHNVVDLLNGTVANGGLGIAVAGNITPADGNYENFAQYQRVFQISNNVITRVRQGIHVEYADGFAILDNVLDDIRAAYSASAGIEVAGIAVYGAGRFRVAGNSVTNSDASFEIAMRVVAGAYTGSSRDFVFQGNSAIDAGPGFALVQSSNDANPMISVFRGNTFIRSPFTIKGGGHVTIDGNTFLGDWGQVPFTYTYRPVDLASTSFVPTFRTLIRITNNNVSDPIGRVPASIIAGSIGADATNAIIEAHGNNFPVATGTTAIIPSQRTYVTSLGTFPYGIEFQQGDQIIDQSAGAGTAPRVWVVTTSGSRVRPNDLYTVVSAATGTITSNNGMAWTQPGYHSVGQAITLTDGNGVTVSGVIAKIYVASSQFRMDLIVGATGQPLNLGSLGPGTITATTPVAYAGP